MCSMRMCGRVRPQTLRLRLRVPGWSKQRLRRMFPCTLADGFNTMLEGHPLEAVFTRWAGARRIDRLLLIPLASMQMKRSQIDGAVGVPSHAAELLWLSDGVAAVVPVWSISGCPP